MKKNYFLLLLLALLTVGVNAQIDPFFDDMESYPDGQPVFENWWTSWDGTVNFAGVASSAQAYEGSQSYLVAGDPDNIDPVLDLGNKIFGDWQISFYMYIPAGKEGYMNMQGTVPIGGGEWVVGNIFFNQDGLDPGNGLIDDSALGVVPFTYPEGEWFLITMTWDINLGISLATWSMYVAGNEVIPPGTAYTSSDGTTATSLGGINFFSITTNNEYYLDAMTYTDDVSGVNDLQSKGLAVYPNPVKDVLNVQAKEAISAVEIYNVLGQRVHASNVNALASKIDMSQMASGAYFVKVSIGGEQATIKVIR